MKNPKFWLAVLVGGIVANILDFVIMGGLFRETFLAIESIRPEGEIGITWFVIGDFVAALVFMVVYDRVYSSFSPGAKGGATFGAYAGLLVSFPMWIFVHMMFKGFPYGLAWELALIGIVWGALVGAVMGSIYRKS